MLCLVVAMALLADDPVWLSGAASAARDYRVRHLSEIKQELAAEKRRLSAIKRAKINERVSKPTVIGGFPVFPNKAFKEKGIADSTARVADLDEQVKGKCVVPSLTLSRPPSVGLAGTVGHIGVIQVHSPTLARVRLYYKVPEVSNDGTVRVGLAHFEALLERDTSEWSDGLDLPFFDTPVVFHRTHEYKTVTGAARTLPVAREWTKEELARFHQLSADQ